MEEWQCCRTCLSVQNLNPIFAMSEHSEKYSEVILDVTGVQVAINDTLSQYICSQCVIFINQSYKFRKKCEYAQKCLNERLQYKNVYKIKIEPCILRPEDGNSIDISELLDDFGDYEDNITLNEFNLHKEINFSENLDVKSKEIKKVRKRVRKKEEEKSKKKERVREEIECELCHKVLTSRLSLRNHYKIHTGFDVICEHCGKKFITRRLLLMHCKAKHGYEKTDKCSYCEYRASNAEQVKIHERLHTGEKPYKCKECDACFHRKSSYLQHVAIHLPDKTVQCEQCPSRFKSVTLMRIHMNRHRAPQYTFRCRICDNKFARRRNVARHLLRIHAVHQTEQHIDRTKCV